MVEKIHNFTNPLSIAQGGTGVQSNRGLIIASNGTDTDHDIDFAAGNFSFSDYSGVATLSAITKQADATWASGTNAGGMASGQSLPTSGTVHCFALSNASGSLVDAGFDTSVAATNLIADSAVTTYFGGTPKFKRIASLTTNGSANIVAFIQEGKVFSLDVPVRDVSASPTATRTNHTLSIPSGVKVNADIFIQYNTGTSAGSQFGLILNPAITDSAPSSSLFNVRAFDNGSVVVETSTNLSVVTNTSNQISSRFTSTSGTLQVITLGWTDYQL